MIVRFRLANWLVYLLAGYPHLLFALRGSLPAMATGFGITDDPWLRLTLIYGLLLGFGLLLGLVRRLPRWSGSWIGFGLLFVLELLVHWFPEGIPAWVAGLLWLAVVLLALTFLARRDRLSAVLAALPVAPMFAWSLALSRIQDMPVEVLLLMASGFVLAVLSVALTHLERGWLAAPLVILTIGGFSLLISFAISSSQIPTPQIASLAGIFSWTGSEIGFLGTAALFTAPAWVNWLIEQFRTRG
jgi:hypothetical protein